MPKVRSGSLLVLALALGPACSHDWDEYDPRLGSGASTGSGGVAGSGASGGAGASGGGGAPSGGASGGGGTPSGGASGGGGTPSGGASGGGGTPSGGGGAPSGGGGSGNTGGTGGTGATGGGGTGGSGPTTLTYVANVADCVSLTNPDPDACEAGNPGFLSVDNANDALATSDAGPAPASAGFLRFNLDSAFAGKSIINVELVVRAGTSTGAASDHTGEVWTVSPFTRPDLFSSVPAKVAKVANDLGAVASGATITWTIPSSTISAGAPACFGIFTNSTNGVDYQNTKGNTPPRLLVTYQ
ncbi:MAG: hypothetical protein HS104_29280 [Polyangiaceae bacterium]|nr:hypothetical protein [Polyangiaceae bacterium]MCL4755933.1 hypothetical protein [Myxococcales bacterium]